MGKRASNMTACVERMYKAWEYLRFHTDKDHPTKPEKIRKSFDEDIFGDKETFNRMIKRMAYTMNCDEFGVIKAEKDWKICFRDFQKYYGDDVCDDEEEDETGDPSMRLNGLYYNRTFSYEEVNSIIEGILSTKTLDTKSAANLIQKVEQNLTTKFYKKGPKQICKVMEPELMDREQLRMNLLTIQKAIDARVQVSFRFNSYTRRKKLAPVRDEKDTVSPYYIVASGGRYYLLACMEVAAKDKAVKNMSIWRIDLMTEIEIPGADEKKGKKGCPRIPKAEVENLPKEWTEDFQLKHINMSFDEPEMITLKIKNTGRENFTFLHDWFGNQFVVMKSAEAGPYDIVRVPCSPFGMVNWALQYSDRVEVLEPKSVREQVIKKIKNLNVKYGADSNRNN